MVAPTHWVCFPFFLRELMFWLPILVLCFGGLFVWVVSRHAGVGQFHPNSEGSTVLLCSYIVTDRFPLHKSWTIYGMQLCASNCRLINSLSIILQKDLMKSSGHHIYICIVTARTMKIQPCIITCIYSA